MSQDAYSSAGVSQRDADSGVAALVASLGRIDTGKPKRAVDLPGHYASVIRLDDTTGIALTTDGVGTKLLIAEQLGRWDTVGIDCVAMNANDLVCLGAEPLAMVDYIAVPTADPAILSEVGIGLRRGAELAGIEIPGGEIAQLGEMVAGLDLSGACIGVVRLDSIVDGARIEPGDVLIGVPSSGLHSNGYTLARKALEPLGWDDDRLGRPLGDIMLKPTEMYVRAVLDLLAPESGVDVRGLAHITGDGLNNLMRLSHGGNDGRDQGRIGFDITDPLKPQPVFDLIAAQAGVSDEEMYEVFNMGCGFIVAVDPNHADQATAILDAHHPGSRPVGTANHSGQVTRH